VDGITQCPAQRRIVNTTASLPGSTCYVTRDNNGNVNVTNSLWTQISDANQFMVVPMMAYGSFSEAEAALNQYVNGFKYTTDAAAKAGPVGGANLLNFVGVYGFEAGPVGEGYSIEIANAMENATYFEKLDLFLNLAKSASMTASKAIIDVFIKAHP